MNSETEAATEHKFTICSAFSADKNDIVYSYGNRERKINGGLGFTLLIYYVLLLINKNKISWTDEVIANSNAEKENAHVNSLGLLEGEKVDLFTLFCAATSIGAPDAVVAISNHILNTIGEENGTIASLQRIGKEWGLTNECIKNLTGRFFEQNPQYFTVDQLIIVAKELLAFDVQNSTRNNSIVYKGKYLSNNSIMASSRNIMRYLCFGEINNYHAIAMASNKYETLYIAACGAKNPLERDNAIIKAIHNANRISARNQNPESDRFISLPHNVLTICGDTYCGERYTKWRIKRDIDDPIQRYGDDGYIYSFENVKQFLTDSFNIVNSECVLSPVYDKTQQTGKYLDFILGAHPEKTINCYKKVNINAVMLANNHMMDFGAAGCRQTKKYFEEAGIITIGTGTDIDEAEKPVCLLIDGCRVIIFNAYGYFLEKRHRLFQHYCLGDNTGTAFISDILLNCSIFERITEYREKYPEAFIVLSPHWGKDFSEEYKQLRSIAIRAIDAGVDFIVGHGPHIPIGTEHISGNIVVYSLGNFVFNTTGIDLDASGKSPYGIISQLYFQEEKIVLKLYPIYAHNLNTFFQPLPVNDGQFTEFCEQFIGEGKYYKNKDRLGYNLELRLK